MTIKFQDHLSLNESYVNLPDFTYCDAERRMIMKRTVVICGDCGEKELTSEIVRACSENGGALVCDGDRIYSTCEEPSFLIFSVCTLSDLYIPDCIVVLGKALLQIRDDIDLSGNICIIDGENSDSIRFAAAVKADVIGCSMSGHDSLTVSSFGEDGTAIITLRRSIDTSCCHIEPCEFKVKRKENNNIYPLLASCAVLMLGGRLTENST